MFKIFAKLLNYILTPKKRAEYMKKNNYIKMGEGCEIFRDVSFGSEPYLIQLGNKVRITSGVRFVNHDGALWVIRNLGWNPNADKMDRIIVGDNVFIGINTIIMPGVKIGSNVVIGAGSIVANNVPDNMVVAGIPAKEICTVSEYYNKNLDKIHQTKQMPYRQKKEYYLHHFGITE